MSIILVNGSFNPITKCHVALAEHAHSYLERTGHHISKILFSPVHQAYPFKKLEQSVHRIAMIQLAVAQSPLNQIMAVNEDEVLNPSGYQSTSYVALDLQQKYSGNIFLVGGADLLAGMARADYWPPANVERLFSAVNVIVFNRSNGKGAITREKLLELIRDSILQKYQGQIELVDEEIGEASSSAAREGRREFLTNSVAEYIDTHGLYK